MPGPVELPFTAIDEGIFHLERATNPWNIQLEIGSRGRLDKDRLEDAVTAACAKHTLTRSRMRAWQSTDKHYTWAVGEPPARVLVQELEPPDGDLKQLRSDFYSPPIPIQDAPALRVALVRRPDGDLVMLAVNHVMTDGVGTLRLMHSITRVYRGVEDPDDPVALQQARDLYRTLAPAHTGGRKHRRLDNLGMLRDGLLGPARIGVDSPSEQDAYGFAARRLDAADTKALAETKPPGTTLNDMFLAALHLTIGRWNDSHGRSTRRVVLMVPFNIRPEDRLHEVVSNIVTFVNLRTSRRHRRSMATAVAEVSRQSRRRKKARGAGLHDLAALGRNVPLGIKRQVPRLLPLTRFRFIATAVLSNLGRLPETPTFETDDTSPAELWFSPPCAMPLGVGVGIATLDGVLHVMVRYRLEQFDATAGERFADLLLTQLQGGVVGSDRTG